MHGFIFLIIYLFASNVELQGLRLTLNYSGTVTPKIMPVGEVEHLE